MWGGYGCGLEHSCPNPLQISFTACDFSQYKKFYTEHNTTQHSEDAKDNCTSPTLDFP
jgi:hypothetical protein